MEINKFIIKPIDKKTERAFLAKWHYSKKAVPNSSVILGCFNGVRLIGSISFGKIINCIPIFEDEPNTSGLELNRLALVDDAPKNSESWFLMHSVKILVKNYKWLRFIHTWADGLFCQGGTIYKACGFDYLRKIPISRSFLLPDGTKIHSIALAKTYFKTHNESIKNIKTELAKVKHLFGDSSSQLSGGYNYQYVYCIDKGLRDQYKLIPQPYEKNMRQ